LATTFGIQLLIWCAAFWTAIALFLHGHRSERRSDALRFLAGLALGAAFAHLGWAALNLATVRDHPGAWFNPAVGYSILFLPVGVLLLAPWSAALRSLPLAIAVARIGCLVSGCCSGIQTSLFPWGFHPTPVYEIALFVALHFAVWRLRDDLAIPAVLIGFGLIRLAVEPLRAAAPLGEPLISASWIAALWIALGVGMVAAPGMGLGRRKSIAGALPASRAPLRAPL
jgi:hypothetical protein